jgi:hypothetical protein
VVQTLSALGNALCARRVPDCWSDPVLYFHAVAAAAHPPNGQIAFGCLGAARIERDAVVTLPAIADGASATGTGLAWHRQRLRPGGDR